VSEESGQVKKTSTSQRKRARKLALQALYQWRLGQADISQIEAEFRTDNDFEKVDGAYFKEVLHGVPAHLNEIDSAIDPLLDRHIDDVDPIEISLLRMGVYELKYRIDIPYRVVINEAVELGKQFGGTDGHKYINSILDKLSLKLRHPETKGRAKPRTS